MNISENSAVVRYDNVLASPRGLTETHGKKVVLFVPASEIRQITLKFGRTSHSPIVMMILGVIFVPIGIYGLVDFFLRPAGFRFEMGMAAFGLIGGSLIFDTLKKRFFLEVQQIKGGSRLIFSKNATLENIAAFCAKIEESYQYQVTNAADNHGKP